MNRIVAATITLALVLAAMDSLWAAEKPKAKPGVVPADTSRGDAMISDYFRCETERLTAGCLAEIKTLEDWNARRDQYRRQLFEMLGLDPLPARTPLKPVVTGKTEHPEFVVEKLHFQSRPGLYVTGNLYVPRNLKGKAPTILYVCGHGRVKKNGISYGNKAHYQHHGGWFARNGYVCLTIDTLQLGEIEGIHHGTYNQKMWWWHSRGYTSAGVEAWNCIRALDYLETRPEVDAQRIGVTGRSGGGAYSWWIAALDERIKVAVPVAGITSLKNHVVDGCVEGHCDCMYQVNTYEWDFPQIAALIAPRPLLISNTDKDRIFPLDGVVDVYVKTRRIYELHKALKHVGLQITEGPHSDTQELRVHAFHWFNKFLKGDDPLIETTAVKFFEPEQLKVFAELPADEKNTTIQETFTPKAAPPAVPKSKAAWQKQRDAWMTALREKVFRGWPADTAAGGTDLDVKQVFCAEHGRIVLRACDFTSQPGIRLRLYLAHRSGLKRSELDRIDLNTLDDTGWTQFLAAMQIGFKEQLKDEDLPDPDEAEFARLQGVFKSSAHGIVYFSPRGCGPTAWSRDERKRTHIRRRFALLGQTADGMRVWDVCRAVRALRSLDGLKNVPLHMGAEGGMAGIVLYASLFTPDVQRLKLDDLPATHRDGPQFLNVLRFLDVPQAAAMALERCAVDFQTEGAAEDYPKAVAKQLGWAKR